MDCTIGAIHKHQCDLQFARYMRCFVEEPRRISATVGFSQIGELNTIPLTLDGSEIPAEISDFQAIDFKRAHEADGSEFRKAYDPAFSALKRSLHRLNPRSIYLQQLRSLHPAQRADAVRALSNKPDARIESTLVAALRDESSEFVRFELTRALGKAQSGSKSC